MITVEIDKSGWGEGPWQHEPDRVDFVHEGFACLALRNPRYGNWCGYVGVPREHPLYGKPPGETDLGVHHDVNYAAPCDGLICHVPQPGMPDDVWWFGFDCGHTFDLCPGRDAMERSLGMEKIESPIKESYCTLPYVKGQIKRLAEQLRDRTLQ